MRLELTSTGFAIRRLSRLATRAVWNGRRDSNSRVEFGRLACFQLHHFRKESGAPYRIRTDVSALATACLQPTGPTMQGMKWSGRTESNCHHEFPGLGCSRYTTPRNLVRQVRLELTIPCLRGRCLDPIWLLTHGGTERTRTVIGLVDNQVPHLSATAPNIADWRLPNCQLAANKTSQ